MRDTGETFSVIRLHGRNDYCWGVVDDRGALIEIGEKLAFQLTRDEATKLAADLNLATPATRTCARRDCHA